MSNEEIIDARLRGHGSVIIAEAQRAGLELALAAALVEQESGGRNVFGCDHGDTGGSPPYCNEAVTQARVQALRDGGNYSYGMNGVGLPQITWWSYVEEAEALGGAHLPSNQLRVGFRLLANLIDSYGYWDGIAAYNAGEGNIAAGAGYANQLAEKRSAWIQLLDDTGEGTVAVTPQDLIDTAREMIGAPYWQWDGYWPPADGGPFWMTGDVSVELVRASGVNCSGLVNAVRRINGLEPLGGTGAIGDYMLELADFDPTTPGVPGALALRPWTGGVGNAAEGHVALYTGEHSIIQAIYEGVTESYTDTQTYYWGGATAFTTYGLQPGVDYSGGGSVDPSPPGGTDTWREYGWYQYASPTSYELRYMPPTTQGG